MHAVGECGWCAHVSAGIAYSKSGYITHVLSPDIPGKIEKTEVSFHVTD